MHALTGQVTVTGLTFQEVGADLIARYTLKRDGTAAAGFTRLQYNAAYRLYDVPAGADPVAQPAVEDFRESLATVTSITDLGAGSYAITIVGGANFDPSRFVFYTTNGSNPFDGTNKTATVFFDYPVGQPAYADVVSDQACINCHGDTAQGIHVAAPMGAQQCTVCHSASNSPYPSLVSLAHGIHNSANYAGGYELDGHELHVTYPTYMTNCSVCHDSPTALDAANSMPVSGEGCLSCHGAMESWEEGFTESGTTFHLAYTEATNCAGCHRTGAGAEAPGLVTVTDFHNGLATERGGIVWNGVDTSVVEGDKIDMQITAVAYNEAKTQMTVSWTAKYATVAVNPCNATPAAGAPAFHAVASGNNMSILRSYAQGDDFSIGLGTSPGQPSSAAVNTTNTTCASNVATTTLTVETPPAGATRAIVALQGKPWVPAVDPADADGRMQVRALTPTREFVVGTGAAPAVLRRPIADTEQCVKCHVGSLYQHGGNRVDNVDMCVICHNAASSEQNVRVGMGVDKTDSYDGLNGQTYEFKSMLHAIHSSGHEGQNPIVIYRSNGIYAWAPDESLLRNWKAGAPCTTSATSPPNNGNIVFGSSPETCRVHNFHIPTYPRPLNDCAACHKPGFDTVPDQAKAVATTLDAGAAPWPNQIDDVLQGASAAACTSCHQSTDAKGHAYQNGWTPQTFPNGRQTILDTQ